MSSEQPRSRLPGLRSAATVAAGRGGASVLSAVWFVVIARTLSTDVVGDAMLLLALAAIAMIIADAGVSVRLAASIGRRPGGALSAARAAGRARLVLSVPGVAVVVGGFAVAGSSDDLAPALLLACSVPATANYTTAAVALRSSGWARPEALNEVLSRCLVLGVGSALLFSGGGLRSVVVAYVAADIASAFALGTIMRRKLADLNAEHHPLGRVREILPLSLAAVLGTVYYRIDLTMLALLRTAPEVALYGAAYRIFEALLMPAGAVAAIVAPRVAAKWPIKRQILAAAGVSAAGSIVLLAAAPSLLATVFGAPYEAAAPALRVLLLAAVPAAVGLVVAQAVAVRSPRALGAVSASAVVLNVVLNLWLIPAFGGTGAAWATAGTEAVVLFALLGRWRRGGRTEGPDAGAAVVR